MEISRLKRHLLAIGETVARIVQKAAGFLGGSFNTQEFFHGKAAGFLRSVKWLFLACAFAVPLLLLAAVLWGALAGKAVLVTTFVVQFAGLLAERWFFFAEANHPQNLYYQAIA